MKVELKENQETSIEAGDVLVLENGEKLLIVRKLEGDFNLILVNLNSSNITGTVADEKGAVIGENAHYDSTNKVSAIVRIIKTENLKLVEV